MAGTIKVLYLDDCEIDHRLMDAYLQMDNICTYALTPCSTLEEAQAALHAQHFDALVLDSRVPPYTDYHPLYEQLKTATGFNGPTVVISADTTGAEFSPARRHDQEIVVDKANLLNHIRTGKFAEVVAPLS